MFFGNDLNKNAPIKEEFNLRVVIDLVPELPMD
jgi:hypothetical protein